MTNPETVALRTHREKLDQARAASVASSIVLPDTVAAASPSYDRLLTGGPNPREPDK